MAAPILTGLSLLLSVTLRVSYHLSFEYILLSTLVLILFSEPLLFFFNSAPIGCLEKITV